MGDATAYAALAARIVELAAVPAADRPGRTAEAAAALASLKTYAQGGPLALAEYGKRLAAVAVWLNVPCANLSCEPWAAFTAGGPDRAPPAVALLRPKAGEPGLAESIFTTMVSYTGPGLLYQLLVQGKVPTNGLMEALQSTMGAAAENIAGAAGDMAGKLLIGAALIGGLYLWSQARGRR